MSDRPRLAVWKFSSCDGCQLTLLDCEDELLALTEVVDIAYFLEAGAAEGAGVGPYDLSLVEGSISTPDEVEKIHQVREVSRHLVTIGACATAGGIQALRNFGDVEELLRIVYATPGFLSTLSTVTPISDHVERRLRTARVPDRQASAARSDLGLPRGSPARRAEPRRVLRVQGRRHALPAGRRRHTLPRTGDPRRMRGALPSLRAGLLRMLRPDGLRTPRAADRNAAGTGDE